MTEANLRNLYTALILGGATKNDANSYSVRLEVNRLPLLKKYIKLAKISELFTFSYTSEHELLHFELTPLLIVLHDDWSSTRSVIEYVSPSQLNINVFNLWISLFHEVKNRKLYMTAKHFMPAAQETLSVLYSEVMRFNLSHNSLFFTLDYREFFLQSYQNRRPVYEVDSLTRVLGQREINVLRKIRTEYDAARGVQGL